MTKFYTNCDNCEGEGGVSVYCCRGYDDIGNPDCGCHGQGDWEDCNCCDGTGKVFIDDIEWDKKLKDVMEIKNMKVIRVAKTEYELENGDIYPHLFELDDDMTIEEFQILLDKSKKMVLDHIKD